MRVASPPYRSASLNGFTRMLNVPPQVLKDCIKIMRLELFPDIAQGGPGLKWNVQFCLRVPPPPSIIPIGMPAVVICRLKVLFYVSIKIYITKS
jgi:mediator of RNA polymerase II transcription subunit 14